MNYLAHLYLAGNTAALQVGGILGDFVKGPVNSKYCDKINEGIMLHRKIDSFSDAHPRILQSKKYFQPSLRKYTGIIIDICYDHFLIQNWCKYSNIQLSEFTLDVYDNLQQYHYIFENELKFLANRITLENLLTKNQDLQGIRFTLGRISKRLKRKNSIIDAVTDIEHHYPQLESDFFNFFSDLIDFVRGWKQSNTINNSKN